MLRKKITYTNFNGETKTKEFLFNLMQTEVLELQLTPEGGLDKTLELINKTEDNAKLYQLFKSIVSKAYGDLSIDGETFVKSEELSNRFMQSGAYDALFIEFLEDANNAAAFIKGIMPPELPKRDTNTPANNIVSMQ